MQNSRSGLAKTTGFMDWWYNTVKGRNLKIQEYQSIRKKYLDEEQNSIKR